ncbi:MAG: hypothetical protein WC628_04415, partial [Candidatus Omnitrophota bacterium]
VGIGTTAPGAALQVGTYASEIRLGDITGGSSGSAGSLSWVNSGLYQTAQIEAIYDGAGTYGALLFKTNYGAGSATERMRITHTGNVGIGTTSPNALLQVAGTINATSLGSTPLSTSGNLQVTGTGAHYISQGNVGIGTTAPSQLFQVGPTTPTGVTPYSLLNGLRISGGDTSNTIWQSVADTNLIIAVNSTLNTKYVGLGATSNSGLVVTGAGNVGIGTTGPGAGLEVIKTGTTAIFRRSSTVASGGTVDFGSGTGLVTLASSLLAEGDFSIKDDAGATMFFIKENGNVGIGTTSPLAKLQVEGQYFSNKYALAYGATLAVNWANGNVQAVTLTGNVTTITFSGGQAGGRYMLIMSQDGTGSRTVSGWPTSPTLRWPCGIAPTMTAAASKTDVYSFVFDGTSYYGGASQNY